ncbi:MAG: hypothetical protein P1U56_21140 [Saprospiraceae bacterium]|nr:hypothetical protein [Saprospiraceae bacterium]
MPIFPTIANGSLILFTYEASQGQFVKVLGCKEYSINYLFGLAYLPPHLALNLDERNYTCLSKSTGYVVYKSKQAYMENFSPEIF